MQDDSLRPEVLRLANATIVTLYNLECLIDKGIVEGPKLLTESGRKEAEKLIAEGFECTEEEIDIVMSHFMNPPQETVH